MDFVAFADLKGTMTYLVLGLFSISLSFTTLLCETFNLLVVGQMCSKCSNEPNQPYQSPVDGQSPNLFPQVLRSCAAKELLTNPVRLMMPCFSSSETNPSDCLTNENLANLETTALEGIDTKLDLPMSLTYTL